MAIKHDLDPLVEKIEFKYTLDEKDRSRVRAKLGTAGTKRTVHFYETKERALSDADLVLRFRTTEGEKDDSTVKLRPVDLAVHGAALQQIPGIKFEADKVGQDYKVSAKLDDKRKAGSAQPSEVAVLFAEQKALLDAHLPNGVDLGSLPALGPINALTWELKDFEGFPFDLDVEEWNIEDELVFLELSCKVDRAPAPQVDTAFTALIKRLKLNPNARQVPKTDQALAYFTARL